MSAGSPAEGETRTATADQPIDDTAEPHPAPLLQDPDEYEEDADYTRRKFLGFRPIYYRSNPDQRPCPSWCWRRGRDGDHHEVHWRHPLQALHTLDGRPSVATSLYPGGPGYGQDGGATMATIEPRLEQLGQEAPSIRVAFREYDGRDQSYNDELLRLSLTDAEELIAVLQYLVRTAEQA